VGGSAVRGGTVGRVRGGRGTMESKERPEGAVPRQGRRGGREHEDEDVSTRET
jgi:hypothetical protein